VDAGLNADVGCEMYFSSNDDSDDDQESEEHLVRNVRDSPNIGGHEADNVGFRQSA